MYKINFIPQITSSEEVYDIGCLCDVKIREQKEFGQGLLIKPLSICKITEFTLMPSPIGQVQATVYKEDNLIPLTLSHI